MQAQVHIVAGFTYPVDVFQPAKADQQCTRAQEQRVVAQLSNALGECGTQKAKNLVLRPFQSATAKLLKFDELVNANSATTENIMPRELFNKLWPRIACRPSWTYPAGV